MQGLMMDYSLTLQHAYKRAVSLFPRKEIVTQLDDGLHRYTYRDWGKRTAQLANALLGAGVRQGDRIATLGWNTYRHLELYFAIPCIGAVLHTLNMRLFSEQLVYIINNAEDSVIFVDGDLVPLLESLANTLPTVKQYVVMGDAPGALNLLSEGRARLMAVALRQQSLNLPPEKLAQLTKLKAEIRDWSPRAEAKGEEGASALEHLVSLRQEPKGYFELDDQEEWQSFRAGSVRTSPTACSWRSTSRLPPPDGILRLPT